MLLRVYFKRGFELANCKLDHFNGIRSMPEVSKLEKCPSPSC